ncbi:metallophosphoesterase family protein [Nocardia ignorata]|uniref:Calcineurin-like phosphoesterase family protein n=1 Tax=Nocardia ignorata TaxID=145285 RepID=A0A4R6NYG4_NOCIG|nr:metallophosphoesterase [Nocardia ignorata]TDP29800.1 calcineurin-like phosphoesterase family protein [Nocardia ignorata]
MIWESVNPQRVAVAGDWHGNSFHADRAIRYAAEHGAQAILHVGDFAYKFAPSFMARVQRALEDTGLLLGFADGNHDDHDKLGTLVTEHGQTAIPMRPNIFYLPRGYRWTWSGVSFLALGGAHSVDRPWRPRGEWWARETITIGEAVTAANGGRADVMICHDVPDGVRIPCIEGNPHGFPEPEIAAAQRHRELLRRVVDEVRPKCLFAGHYHCRLDAPLVGRDYRTEVHILDMDGRPMSENVMVTDLAALREPG